MSDGDVERRHAEGLQRVLSQLDPAAAWSCERVGGGMTNLNWKVSNPARRTPLFVQLMMPREEAYRIGIDREVQARVLEVVQRHRLSPQVVLMTQDPAAMVTEFIEATPMPTSGDARTRALEVVVDKLAYLHHLPVDESLRGLVSDSFVGAVWFEQQARAALPERSRDIDWVISTVRRLADARGPYEQVLLHSDLSPQNILVGDQTILIDWEYSGLGDRWADLGDLAVKCELTEAEERAALERYSGQLDETELAYTRIHRFAGMARECLWAFATTAVGYSDFDHESYGGACLARLRAYASSSLFRDALRTLGA